jgi:3D (Asp-Asp-Asp) domain-containing protein
MSTIKQFKILNKTIIVLILIALIVAIGFVFLIREYMHLDEYRQKIEQIQQAEQRHLENSQDLIANYNQLYKDYQDLYDDYQRLWVNLSAEGWQEFTVTGYSANDSSQGTNDIVATGFDLDYKNVKNLPIIATDPNVIPLYSIVEIEGMGAFISLDVGGAIKGNRIDIYFEYKEDAFNFGRQTLLARVIK